MRKLLLWLSLVFLQSLLSLSAQALTPPHYGMTLSVPLVTKEPPHLRGFQFMLNYDPGNLIYKKLSLYFDGGFSHFSDGTVPYYTGLNIYSAAPVLRYHLQKEGLVSPYLELSIGLSYLTRTRLEYRNLGIHFAFQDRVGIGALIGQSERFSVGHYSNARLSAHNSGITIPLMLDIGYRF